jgi:hypothetical protein
MLWEKSYPPGDHILTDVSYTLQNAPAFSLLSTKSIVISKTEKIKFEIDATVLRKWGPHQNDSAQQDESNGMLVV